MINALKSFFISSIKKSFGIEDLSLWIRIKKQNIEKIFFHKKYTAHDILTVMISQGLKPGDTIIVHCAMNNFYNYKGSAKELIDTILNYLGPEGTLCMPAYPYDKNNPNIVFDLEKDRTAAGFLAETFRHYPGIKRSMNKLHSVCALGRNAEFLTSEHQYSRTCFDEKSPFYKLTLLNGKSFSLGMPKHYIGTIEHVSESLLYDEISYFKDKFTTLVTFSYINQRGEKEEYSTYTKMSRPYIRRNDSYIEDTYFDKQHYNRHRLSNMWISMFDTKYTVNRLLELSRLGKTIYKSPKFYK